MVGAAVVARGFKFKHPTEWGRCHSFVQRRHGAAAFCGATLVTGEASKAIAVAVVAAAAVAAAAVAVMAAVTAVARAGAVDCSRLAYLRLRRVEACRLGLGPRPCDAGN